MPAALGGEFALVAEFQQRVQMLGAFEVDAASLTAVAATGSAARNELFTTKGDAAISAVTARDADFRFINEHGRTGTRYSEEVARSSLNRRKQQKRWNVRTPSLGFTKLRG